MVGNRHCLARTRERSFENRERRRNLSIELTDALSGSRSAQGDRRLRYCPSWLLTLAHVDHAYLAMEGQMLERRKMIGYNGCRMAVSANCNWTGCILEDFSLKRFAHRILLCSATRSRRYWTRIRAEPSFECDPPVSQNSMAMRSVDHLDMAVPFERGFVLVQCELMISSWPQKHWSCVQTHCFHQYRT